MYKVLLVDDEILVREAISAKIQWQQLGFELAGDCENGKDAIEFLEETPVDVVLTDICMPYVDGMALSKYQCHLVKTFSIYFPAVLTFRTAIFMFHKTIEMLHFPQPRAHNGIIHL